MPSALHMKAKGGLHVTRSNHANRNTRLSQELSTHQQTKAVVTCELICSKLSCNT